MNPSRHKMPSPPKPSAVAMAFRALAGRLGRALAETSPLRLLLLICLIIGMTHSLTMLFIHGHMILPAWIQSLVESALLVLVLFPALYFFSFRPLLAQIAERRLAETIMRESEHKYRHLFNSLGDAAFLIELESGRMVDANQQAEKLLGRPRGEILGKSCGGLFPAEKADEYRARLLPRGAEDASVGFEAEAQTQDGRLVPVHVSSAPLALFGHDLVVSLFRDITEFKTLHAELLHAQRLESVGALASGIAHDLNNALTPILFATDLLQGQPQGTSHPRLLEVVGSSAARASQIVRQMLAFVRGGGGQRADVQLRHLVREAADMARVAFPRSIQIHEHLPSDLWTVKADSAQVSQVLMNLAVNARDAMPDGGELNFSAENREVADTGPHAIPGLKAGFYAVLNVADTGCGIPPEIKDKIFDPFFTTKPAGKGTGLGLATTRDIVQGHHGLIRVLTAPGQGTDFQIFLPANPDAPVAPMATASQSAPKGRGELVLIADDEAFILEMTRLVLESAGYRVLQARDGTEAVALAVEHKGDLQVAIIDRMMPFLDGNATIRALHKINPSLKTVQISGVVDPAECVAAGKTGGPPLLQKPFSGAQLLEAVNAALRA
ncbi:MAG: PAS domain S-box protein [Opitutae bacterium]|nr:PAS domain S-box protein [Opitutae bacterium]